MLCQRRRFQHFVQSQIGQVERRSWTRHSLKSSQAERLNCWEQTWNKWISSLKHLKSVPFDFSHFDLSAMVLQEVRKCQLRLANLSWHIIPFIPSEKTQKKLPNRFPVRCFPIVFFQISSIGSCRFLQTTLVNNPSQAVGLCKCFHLGVRMDVVDLSFQWAKLPGNVIPMEVPWIYTNLHLEIFCTYFFWICFCSTFHPFFSKELFFFRRFRLARCCMLFSLGLVWWLAGFLRMPRLSALLKAGGAPKRREDRARLRLAKT